MRASILQKKMNYVFLRQLYFYFHKSVLVGCQALRTLAPTWALASAADRQGGRFLSF